jgi:hypothetical protein
MKYKHSSVEIYLSTLETALTRTTPVPMTIPEEAMNPSCVPSDKEVKRSRKRDEIIRLKLCKNDLYGSLICIHGGKEGAVIQSIKAFDVPGENPPRINMTGVRMDSKELLEEKLFEYVHSGYTACVLVSVSTEENTMPGEYHSAIEIQSEHGFVQIPVIVSVVDVTLSQINPGQPTSFESPLKSLIESFDAYKNGRSPLFDNSRTLMGFCSKVALKNYSMLKIVETNDKQRAEIISNILSSLKEGCGDDTAIFRAREQMLELIAKGDKKQ